MNLKNRIVSILLTTSILLGTCGCDKDRQKQDKKDAISDKVEAEFVEEGKEADYVVKCRREIDAVHPTYKLAEHYLSDEIINTIAMQEKNDVSCSFEMENLDAAIDDVVKKIRENTLKSTSHANIYDGYADFKEDYFEGKYDFEYFIKLCLINILSKSNNDIREDLCALSEYDIVLSDENPYDDAFGRCDPYAKRIVIYMRKIKKYIDSKLFLEEDLINRKERFQELLFQKIYCVLCHEINHVRQDKCSHRYYDGSISLDNYADYIKSSTFVESSAESVLYNLDIDPDHDKKTYVEYSYIDLRTSESLLLLMGMTSPSIDGYYNGIFNTSFLEMYDFFRLETKDELKAFYRILYSIDSVYSRTNLPTEIKYNGEQSMLEYEIGNAYLIDILKISLKNMMDYTISHSDFSLKENITMFTILKNKISLHAKLFDAKSCRFEYGEEFISQFDALIASYESFLMGHYNIDDIKDSNSIDLSHINSICFDIPVIGANGELLDSTDVSEAKQFLEKFPVLRSIVFCEYLLPDLYENTYYFDRMIERNENTKNEEMSLVYTDRIS